MGMGTMRTIMQGLEHFPEDGELLRLLGKALVGKGPSYITQGIVALNQANALYPAEGESSEYPLVSAALASRPPSLAWLASPAARCTAW